MTESIMVQRLNGDTYNLDDQGIRVISFDPPSPNYQYTYTQIQELKTTRSDTQIQQTTIPLVVQIRAKDYYDYELMRQRMLGIFASYEDFYVINMRIPMIRWRVRAQAFDIPRLANFYFTQAVTINLDCAEGFAESVSTTDEENFTTPDSKWGRGQGIPRDQDLTYHHQNENSFDVWNLGHVPLNGDERPVLLTFQGTVSSQLTITNKTTNQVFKLTRGLSSSDKLEIYGSKPLVNGVSAFQNCNHAYLDYAVGKNSMTISGATNWILDISTHFYY